MNSIVTDKVREHEDLENGDDKLGHRNIAKHLFNWIESKEWPISVGIYGKWGSGKSTFVNFLKKEVFSRKNFLGKLFNLFKNIFIVKKILSLNFKNGEGDLGSFLRKKTEELSSVYGVIEIDVFHLQRNGSISDSIIDKIKSARLISIRFVLLVLVSFLSFIFYGSIVDGFSCAGIKMWELIKTTEGWKWLSFIGFSGIILFLAKMVGFVRFFMKLWIYFENQLVNIVSFRKTIIIVENLDRLSPRDAICFLEKLKAFFLKGGKLYTDKFSYIIPCDISTLENEVSRMYPNLEINARDYIGKLIEVPFHLPSYNKRMVKGLVDDLLNNKLKKGVRERVCRVFESQFFETTRDVKNFLLELDMIFVIAKARMVFGEETEKSLFENLDKIIAYLIIDVKCPNLLIMLQEYSLCSKYENRRLSCPFYDRVNIDCSKKGCEHYRGKYFSEEFDLRNSYISRFFGNGTGVFSEVHEEILFKRGVKLLSEVGLVNEVGKAGGDYFFGEKQADKFVKIKKVVDSFSQSAIVKVDSLAVKANIEKG